MRSKNAQKHTLGLVFGLLMTGCAPQAPLGFQQTQMGYDFAIQKQKSSIPAPQKQVRPVLDCVRPNPNGSYTAFFSYFNENPTPLNISVGSQNYFHHNNQAQGQPTIFQPGWKYS